MKKRLMRNRESGIIAGVCAGIGDYCHVNPWVFRVLFLLPFVPRFVPGILSIVIYIVLVLMLPDRDRIEQQGVVEVDYEIVDDEADDHPDAEVNASEKTSEKVH